MINVVFLNILSEISLALFVLGCFVVEYCFVCVSKELYRWMDCLRAIIHGFILILIRRLWFC